VVTLKTNLALLCDRQFHPSDDIAGSLDDMQSSRSVTGFAASQMFWQLFVKHPLAVLNLCPNSCDIVMALKANFAPDILGFNFCQCFRARLRLRESPNCDEQEQNRSERESQPSHEHLPFNPFRSRNWENAQGKIMRFRNDKFVWGITLTFHPTFPLQISKPSPPHQVRLSPALKIAHPTPQPRSSATHDFAACSKMP